MRVNMRLGRTEEELSRRDSMKVARYEVPGYFHRVLPALILLFLTLKADSK
jgi:hypothetical protein